MKHVTPLLSTPLISSLAISLCAALIAGPSAGCGPATPQAEEPSVDRLAPTTLYPMEPGTQWVYDVDTGGGEPPTLGIFEVIEAVGHQRQIANNRGMTSAGQVRHGDPITYEITPDGREQARAWLRSADSPTSGARDDFATQVTLAATLPGADVDTLIRRHRARLMRDLERIERGLTDTDDAADIPSRLSASRRDSRARADLAWLDSVEAQLTKGPHAAFPLSGASDRPRRGRPPKALSDAAN